MPSSVCFVHTPCLELQDDRLEPPLGLLYLATVAKEQGHSVAVIDLSAEESANLSDKVPDGFALYGFSTFSVNYDVTRKIAISVQQRNTTALIVAGGPHATALPKAVLDDGFDVVVTGEGEMAILEILAQIDQGGRLSGIIAGQRPDPLDSLPFPDYELVDLRTYSRIVAGKRSASILTSRGCPYPCVFCNSNIMGSGNSIRFRTPQNVAAEIRRIKERYGIFHFRFQDDLFAFNVKRVRALSPWLKAEQIVYRCFARVNTFSEEMADLLRNSGCAHISFGVESGSPKLLGKLAMNKRQTPEQIRQALVNAHDSGIRTRVFLIVGFPGETDETIEETLALMKQTPWDEFSAYPLIAYPGTPIHETPAAFGITHVDDNYQDYLQVGRNFRAGFTIRTATFDENQVRKWRDYVIAELLADGRIWAGSSEQFR